MKFPRTQKKIKEKLLNLTIERIVPDGYGIGFTDGLTVFVPLTAPGDVITARVERQKGSLAFANIVEILNPSPERVMPPCQYFGRCGGCDFQQMNYESQLHAKVGIIKDALRRIGKIDWQEKIEIIAAPSEWNYRTRAQWKRDGGDKLGYLERNSHRVIDIQKCPILAAPLQVELDNQHQNSKSFAEIQAVSAGKEVSWRTVERQNESFDENFYTANHEITAHETQPRRAARPTLKNEAREISLKIGEFEYAFSAAAFFQVNHDLLLAFVETVINGASGSLALDLYCGVGLFTLPLAKKIDTVFGIEGNSASIKFAEKNARTANLPNAKFEIARVGEWLSKNQSELKQPDLVVLDPPRTGAERETIESLIKLKPKQIIYVSCNPATLARDLKILLSNDFTVEKIRAFDFFPQTHHVETIVHLECGTRTLVRRSLKAN